MRLTHLFVFLLYSLIAHAQLDTVVVYDYTKVMVTVDANDRLTPVTDLTDLQQAGFFIIGQPEGNLKVCNETPLYLWVNGRLYARINGCDFFEPQELFSYAESDSIYVSLYAENHLSEIECQLILFEKLQILKEDPALPRLARNEFREFTIASILILLLLFAFLVIQHPSRVGYLSSRTFTFKISSYEFINTNFLSSASIILLLTLSFLLSFFVVYLDQHLMLEILTENDSFWRLLNSWMVIGGGITILLFIKWIVVSTVSALFQFREINNYQLFDFLNFLFVGGVVIFLGVVLDFVLNPHVNSWIGPGFVYVFMVVLILYIIWFTFKFVNNSPRKKLLIISYLCATEIIPAILIFGWFLK